MTSKANIGGPRASKEGAGELREGDRGGGSTPLRLKGASF